MTGMIFVNLPVRNLAASRDFYIALGGTVNPQFSDEQSNCLLLSEAIGVMLLTHERYGQFTSRPIGDARRETQTLLAINVDSRADVDPTVDRAASAGGKADPNPLQDHGFMYSRSIEDPDGYVWEVFWMDPAVASGEKPAS